MIVVTLIALLAATPSACGPEDGGAGTGADTPAPGPPSGMGEVPGLYDLGSGRTGALGVLTYQPLEGGFWAVADTPPKDPSGNAGVIAVLVGAEDLGVDLEALEGRPVVAEGVLLDGASIRMAGPELRVESLRGAGDAPLSSTDSTG